MIDKPTFFPAKSLLGTGKLCYCTASRVCQPNGPELSMKAMGTALFDTHLSDCCVYSPSLSGVSQSVLLGTSERLLVNVSGVITAGMQFLLSSSPH